MGSEFITVPAGLLNTWGGVQPTSGPNDSITTETFDAQQVAIGRARRALSVSIGGLGRTRETGRETNANAFPILDTSQRSARADSIVDPHDSTSTRRPQRSATVSEGTFARSNVTSCRTSAGSHLPISRDEQPARAAQDFYMSQNFNNYHFPAARPDLTRPLPVFAGRDSTPSYSLAYGERSSDAEVGVRRTSTARSWAPGLDVIRRASIAIEEAVEGLSSIARRSTLSEVYEKAKVRQVQLKRSTIAQIGFQYVFYLFLLACVYFILVGIPLWKGVVWYIYILFNNKLTVPAGTAVFLGIGFLYAYLPLLLPFEKTAPERNGFVADARSDSGRVNDTALLIPCYKSESLIAATLEAALKIFPAESIFVIANGNSPTPLDNTGSVCERYGVSHTWSPLGSKIIAQFVGCYVAKNFPYVLLIDDDCLLPPNFPIVSDRIAGNVKVIGYTIKSVGPHRSRGTLCQQAQDIEYKISGVQRAFAGKLGSATFPHGAISIWDRELLVRTFQKHPGFSVSEDWFFGHVARQLGSRIQMCTSVFVETETPSAIFLSSGGARGGFGEMTVWKQRFYRWNFFFVNGIYYDMWYILFSWKLGWWELGAKLFVFQEVYETLLYLLAPFVLPISFIVRPRFSTYMVVATLGLYMINVLVFNYIHLRSRKEAVTALCLLYYLPYKIILTFVNIASCYYSIYKYAKYFAKRHPKVVEDEAAVGIVLKLEEEAESRPGSSEKSRPPIGKRESSNVRSRKITVTAMGTPGAVLEEPQPDLSGTGIGVYDFASQPRPANSAAPSVIETIITDLQSSRSLNSRWSSVSGPSGFGTDTGKRISSTYD